MNWTSELNELRNVFAYLYSSTNSARTIATQSGVSLLHVNLQDAIINVWQAIVEEAVKQNRVEGLITEVSRTYGENQQFKSAVNAWKASLGTVLPPQPPPVALPDRTVLRIFIIANLQDDFNEFLVDFSGELNKRYGFDAVITPAILGGSNFGQTALNLILYCERRGWYGDLVREVRKSRPHLNL
ncbi:MAG: effector-associated domain EAD1-containing protein [Anaerolineae bacterium]|nr:effector-associated domain EAD1-containing protein [Anaerolineae bacterium]